ncbi:DUF4169 family protein [Aliiroseovarius sp.]|uniref:DUF4169 family protein n=1 Tax=Aliiroseovarius sp. TaxID=1872442 RepID=UPI003BAB892C
MAKVVNLNKARKARDRVKKRAQADENAVKFGLTKAEKNLNKTRAEKSARDLDGHETQ